MALSENELASVLRDGFGLSGALRPLPGEHDQNIRVCAEDGRDYLLKIHGPHNDPVEIDMQAAVLDHVNRRAPGLPLSQQFRTRHGDLLLPCGADGRHTARLLNWLPGDVWAKSPHRGPDAAEGLGRLLGELDLALRDFSHDGARRVYGWDIAQAAMHQPSVQFIDDDTKRACVAGLLDRFVTEISPRLAMLPRQVIHNDANDYNVLLSADGRLSGLLDFGDMVESHRIVEVAVACAYALIGAEDAVGAVLPLVAGYHSANPLLEDEIALLFDLIKLRYAVSIAMAAKQIREQPENRYLLISQEDVWRELQRLERETPRLATLRFRDACGWPAVAAAPRITRWLEDNAHVFAPVVKPAIAVPKPVVIDLSAQGPDAARIAELDDAGFDRYCEARIAEAGADFGVGRYGENRAVYKSAAFETASAVRRTVHLGIDIFAPEGEAVHAPLDGTVAFYHDDDTDFGFGPTVLLEHVTPEGDRFWTLYGHLSRSDCSALRIGQRIAKGERIAGFGARNENGNWPPHLHFQIVTDHLGLEGRMHGVGVGRDWQVWRQISPIPTSCSASGRRPRPSWRATRRGSRRNGTAASGARSASPMARRH